MVLPIVHLPSQVLRRPVEDVVFPLSKDVRRLIKDMLDTVAKADGIGLAAPQVGRNLNLAIIYLQSAGVSPFVIINPKIIQSSTEHKEIEEGCLSMPGVFGMVSRPISAIVEYQDLEGAKQTINDDSWISRVCQHEVDHLLQTLIIDKLNKVTQGSELLPMYTGE
ncbi:MAG: peptide deformylase [Candidatus Doudnabacteria bacterium]|nr:peptide deformylase [Candidatus Doudnabacteria bacterium]